MGRNARTALVIKPPAVKSKMRIPPAILREWPNVRNSRNAPAKIWDAAAMPRERQSGENHPTSQPSETEVFRLQFRRPGELGERVPWLCVPTSRPVCLYRFASRSSRRRMARNFAPMRISTSQTAPRQNSFHAACRNSWGRKRRRRLELELDYRHRILADPKTQSCEGSESWNKTRVRQSGGLCSALTSGKRSLPSS